MIEYMLMNLGFVASAMGTKPEHIADHEIPDQVALDLAHNDMSAHFGQQLERITVAASVDTPIRRTDFL